MSRFTVWALLSVGSGLYNIPRGNVEAFAAAIWFGGMALVIHWLTERKPLVGRPHPARGQTTRGEERRNARG